MKQGDKIILSFIYIYIYIFAKISELIISLQGRSLTVVRITDEVKSLKGNMKLLKRRVREKKIASFPTQNLSHKEESFIFTVTIFV